MSTKRLFLTGPRLALTAAGITLVAVSVTFATDIPKFQPNPDVGRSEQERAEAIAKLQQRNADWARDFIARGSDPRSLPVVDLQTWSAGVETLVDARSQAQVVVAGEVESQAFEQTASGLGASVATIRVGHVVKGAPAAQLQVRQIGGPAWSPTGGELQQLEGDPLLLAGQQVVLLLRQDASGSGFRTVYGAGVYTVVGGRIQAPHSNAFAQSVEGLELSAFTELFR